MDIIAEILADDAELRKVARQLAHKEGVLVTKLRYSQLASSTITRVHTQYRMSFYRRLQEQTMQIGRKYFNRLRFALLRVYSASPLAKEEFPEYDLSLRSAVSIARRLQDPLAELVKIEPKAVGVGQYQHDVTPKKLDEALISRSIAGAINRFQLSLAASSNNAWASAGRFCP